MPSIQKIACPEKSIKATTPPTAEQLRDAAGRLVAALGAHDDPEYRLAVLKRLSRRLGEDHLLNVDVLGQLGATAMTGDIEIAAGSSYMPFVRLSVVRYQPHSLPGSKVSRTVLTEFTQVLPRRKAVVKRVGQRDFSVTLHGPVPEYGPHDLQPVANHDIWKPQPLVREEGGSE